MVEAFIEYEESPQVPVGVSICIPAFRETAYLRRAIASCQRQSYSDFEVVVTDDTEGDSVCRLVESLAAEDRRIRYLRHPGAPGAAANSNYAARAARGQWLKFLYQDDELAGTLALQTFVDSCRSADFIMSACYCVNDRGGYVHRVRADLWDGLERNPVRTLVDNGNFIGPPSAVMLKKELFQEFDEGMVWKFDLLSYIMTMVAGARIAYLDAPQIVVHQHTRQLTNTLQNMDGIEYLESLSILNRIACLRGLHAYAFRKKLLLKLKHKRLF